ncbi:MAG TPA: S8 family serine peptidase, partial [Hanamia sp.]
MFTQVLNNYGLSSDSVRSSFPDFNEADTVIAEIGEGSRQMDYAKVFAISLPDTSFKSSLINSLLNLSEVLYAESDGNDTTDLIPVDGRFGDQWNLHNAIVPNADIHAEAAWDIFTGNPNSIIAIIDAGVDVNHNDLAAKIDGGDNTFVIGHDPIVGDFSHGSHVAGIAAAVTNNNNNNGVAGVDWQARIHPRNVINPTSGDAQITDAINESLNFSPNVWTFNNSWETLPHGRYSVTVRSAFANVYRNNRVQCIAMGNNHTGAAGADDPANFPVGINSGIIAVGATDINDGVAGFSNRGQHIDVSAPGVNITSTNFNNGYVALSGTSMATPHVSGLASLLKGFNTNLANDDIEQIIRLTADDRGAVGWDNQYGTGRINAERALLSLQAPNTLQHLNTTGGTIFSTTANETRIFLGVPGLSDAAYVVKRSEVRTNIIIPAMCSTIGVWGRGVGTTGYREEQGRSFGEGICEIVPGTLTNTSATLRTWIYQVWSINGQYLGFYPANAQNVIFQYTVLGVPAPTTIAGDNIFCNTPSNNYTIPNLPSGASVNWSVTPGGIATPNTPILPQTTLNKNGDGVITLNAIISCGASITITKSNISVGKPQPGPITFPLIDPALGKIQAQVDPVPNAT